MYPGSRALPARKQEESMRSESQAELGGGLACLTHRMPRSQQPFPKTLQFRLCSHDFSRKSFLSEQVRSRYSDRCNSCGGQT